MKNGMNLVPVVIYYTLCVKCFMIFKSKSFIGSKCDLACDMLPSYRTMKYKSPIWGYFHVQKE